MKQPGQPQNPLTGSEAVRGVYQRIMREILANTVMMYEPRLMKGWVLIRYETVGWNQLHTWFSHGADSRTTLRLLIEQSYMSAFCSQRFRAIQWL